MCNITRYGGAPTYVIESRVVRIVIHWKGGLNIHSIIIRN
jgi:hypothetical protein